MVLEEFKALLEEIKRLQCESQTLEIKKAKDGAPTRLYETLSSFSNQDDGGVIVFGLDEDRHFAETGVYNAHELQKRISEQCKEMEPLVRPLISTFDVDGKAFVTAEIPGLDVSRRPCFYKGKGRLKGAYIRVGDSDEPMTEYEIYSYEAFRERRQDDIRIVERALPTMMDQDAIHGYISFMQRERANFSRLPEQDVSELTNLTREGKYTLSAVLMFGKYPQTYYPQMCVTAVKVPGTEMGVVGSAGERFLDNRRIEGTIREMFEAALLFVQANMRTKTVINPQTGHREDQTEYPVGAVREAILNALVHRDYSAYSEGMPIQIRMYADRMEIHNPGGLYGRLRIDQLGKVQPDTRNPTLVAMMEAVRLTENRYSGIPTIRREMAAAGLPEPVFREERGSFVVVFSNAVTRPPEANQAIGQLADWERALLKFCQEPRSKKEISDFLQVKTTWYAIKTYVEPLVEKGLIERSIPAKPKHPRQTYRATVSV